MGKRLAPEANYADYRTDTEAIAALVGAMAHGIEAVRDQRLLPFISRGGKPAKPKQALFWLSNLTLGMIEVAADAAWPRAWEAPCS